MITKSLLLNSQSQATIQVISRVVPYSIFLRIAYTGLKRLLKELFPYKYADAISKLVILKIVRKDYRMYFIICFALEYFFKRYVYTTRKEERWKWKMGLSYLSMGLFAVAFKMGQPRAIKPLNALSGYDIWRMNKWVANSANEPYWRPLAKDANVLLWHAKLYLNATRKAIVPLTLVVAVPTFLFSLQAKRSMEGYITKSWYPLPKESSMESYVQNDYHFIQLALKKAFLKTCRYGLYVTIGLSSYVHLVDMYCCTVGPPGYLAVFVMGSLGAWPYFFIPEDKIYAYDHWALTTMLDAIYQGSPLQEILQI